MAFTIKNSLQSIKYNKTINTSLIPGLTTNSTTNYGSTWTNTGITSGTKVSLASAISGLGQYMIVIVYNFGIYISNDNGTSFTQNVLTVDTYSNAFISWSGKFMYALTFSGKALYSTNYGASFTTVTSSSWKWNWSFDEIYQTRLISNVLYISSDSGVNFNSTGLTGIIACSISKTGQYIVTVTSTVASLSTNYGANFTSIKTALSGVTNISISLDGTVVLIYCGTTLHSSINSGSTWRTHTLTGITYTGSSLDNKYIYGYLSNNVYASSDYGNTFSKKTSSAISNLWAVYNSADGKYILTTTGNYVVTNSIVMSRDYGTTWVTVAPGLSTPSGTSYLFGSMSGDGKNMLLTTNYTSNNAVRKSINST
jgi:hypothetical protein